MAVHGTHHRHNNYSMHLSQIFFRKEIMGISHRLVLLWRTARQLKKVKRAVISQKWDLTTFRVRRMFRISNFRTKIRQKWVNLRRDRSEWVKVNLSWKNKNKQMSGSLLGRVKLKSKATNRKVWVWVWLKKRANFSISTRTRNRNTINLKWKDSRRSELLRAKICQWAIIWQTQKP